MEQLTVLLFLSLLHGYTHTCRKSPVAHASRELMLPRNLTSSTTIGLVSVAVVVTWLQVRAQKVLVRFW